MIQAPRKSGIKYWVPQAAVRTVARSGPNIKQHEKPSTPYASGTHKKVLDRFLGILKILERRSRKVGSYMTTVELGERLDLTPAAAGITSDHLVAYLTRFGLQPRKILQRSIVRGVGVSWEGKSEIASGISLIEQHIKKARK